MFDPAAPDWTYCDRQHGYWAAMISLNGNDTKAIIAAAAARVVAEIGAQTSQAISDKTVFVDAVTKERATWRSELREAAASLIAMLRLSGAGEPFDRLKVQRLRAQIVLRLNPAGREGDERTRNAHPHDRALHGTLEEVWTSDGTPDERHTDVAARLEKSVQLLLKQEWTVSKREAAEGRIVDRSEPHSSAGPLD